MRTRSKKEERASRRRKYDSESEEEIRRPSKIKYDIPDSFLDDPDSLLLDVKTEYSSVLFNLGSIF